MRSSTAAFSWTCSDCRKRYVSRTGPIDLLRRKLAREPQIHGGKQTRVVFYGTADNEGIENRSDR